MPRSISAWLAIICITASATFQAAAAYGACKAGPGCNPTAEPNLLVCSATCETEGYRLSVVKATPGANGALIAPAGCDPNRVSASGQYVILEGVEKKRSYSQSHFSQASGGYGAQQTHVEIIHQSPNSNARYCEADSARTEIYGDVYVVTFQNTQGFRACIPAQADTIDCADVNAMASRFMSRQHAYNINISLPFCFGDCADWHAAGSGGRGTLDQPHLMYDPKSGTFHDPADPSRGSLGTARGGAAKSPADAARTPAKPK